MDTFTNEYRTNNEKEFYVAHRLLGVTTSPQTANQIQEATSRLNAGVRNIELELISPELFDSVPKQHFEEMRRMSKLTGANINIHAPVQNMDLAGFSREGWSEAERKKVEESMEHMIDRGADLGENTVVNFHSSGGVPAYEWQKERALGEKEIPPEGKRKIFVIDQADPSHQIVPLEYEEKEYFGGTKPWTPQERMEMLNRSRWDQEKLQLFNYEKEKAEINDRLRMLESQTMPLVEGDKKEVLNENERKQLVDNMRRLQVMKNHINELNVHMDTQMQDLHDKFVRFAHEGEKKEFFRDTNIKNDYDELSNFSMKKMELSDKREEILRKFNWDIEKAKPELEKIKRNISEKYGNEFLRELGDENKMESRRQRLLNSIQAMPIPERFKPTDDFAREKLSETVANSALYAYKKYKDKTPIIAIENVFPDWTLGRAESLKKAVEESRELFAKKLHEEKNISKEKAKEIASKIIGATWDVGHITQLRKFGYTDEDIAKEAEKIAPVVKHIHVTDNFGFSDSHLAPGHGTVPIKEQLEKLKKGLGEEYGKVAHILESGGFASQFKQSPRLQELQFFNTPLYEIKAAPYWRDIAYTHAEYSMGYGIMFPEKHFDLYGSGFSNLPQELGGQIPGDKSRFAGTPND